MAAISSSRLMQEVCLKKTIVEEMAVSCDGETLILVGNKITVVSIGTGEVLHSFEVHGLGGYVRCWSVAVSQRVVVVGTDSGLFVFRQDATTKALHQIQYIVGSRNACMAFNNAESMLASATPKNLLLWTIDADTGRVEPLPLGCCGPHAHQITAVAWSPHDQHLLATACGDGFVRLLEVREWPKVVATLGPVFSDVRKIPFHLAFDPSDSATIAVGYSSGKVARWSTKAPHGAVGAPIQAHDWWLCRVRYSPCGTVLATGGQANAVKLWDATGVALEPLVDDPTLQGHTDVVTGLEFSPSDPSSLLSCCRDGTVRWWSVTECALGLPFEGPSPPDTPPRAAAPVTMVAGSGADDGSSGSLGKRAREVADGDDANE